MNWICLTLKVKTPEQHHNFTKFTRKHLCRSLLFSEILDWQVVYQQLFQKETLAQDFSVAFAKFFRAVFLQGLPSTFGSLNFLLGSYKFVKHTQFRKIYIKFVESSQFLQKNQKLGLYLVHIVIYLLREHNNYLRCNHRYGF